MHLDQEAIVLDSLHAYHDQMILASVDNFGMDDILALRLTLGADDTRHTRFKFVILLLLLGTMNAILAIRELIGVGDRHQIGGRAIENAELGCLAGTNLTENHAYEVLVL